MKRIFLILSMIATTAFAEVPPPGTSRKGPIKVTPEGMSEHEYDLKTYKVIPRSDSRKVQRMVDGLRKRIRELEDRLATARSLPLQIPYERTVEKRVEVERRTIAPWTIFGGVGAMPDGVYIDEKANERKAQIHEFGTAVQLGGMYHWENGVNAGVNGAMATRDTHLQAYFGTLGYSFGSR